MASLGHIAIGMGAARLAEGWTGSGPRGWGARLQAMTFWSMLSLLPDADVIGFRLGVEYGDPWGHRGATHSLTFAFAGGLLAWALAGRGGLRRWPTALLVAAVLASHGLLDTLTDGGLGAALLWPLSTERFFAPWRPIPVAPIGRRFLSWRGAECVAVELVLFAPIWIWALWRRRPLSLG